MVDIGGFYSPDDEYRHVVVGTDDGNITEFFYHPTKGHGHTLLTNLPQVTRLSAFYAPNNESYNRRVLLSSKAAGLSDLSELRFSPVDGQINNVLLNGQSITDVGGFYSGDDKLSHGALAGASGKIQELFYGP